MGFTEVLTIVFIIFKLLGIINWSWFFVLLPEIIGITPTVLCLIFVVRVWGEIIFTMFRG
jgi:hypothetical protein